MTMVVLTVTVKKVSLATENKKLKLLEKVSLAT